jgi:hypothetical protein
VWIQVENPCRHHRELSDKHVLVNPLADCLSCVDKVHLEFQVSSCPGLPFPKGLFPPAIATIRAETTASFLCS